MKNRIAKLIVEIIISILVVLAFTYMNKGYEEDTKESVKVEEKQEQKQEQKEIIQLSDLKYESGKLNIVEIDEFKELIDNKNTFILLVSQTTCGHCTVFKPIVSTVADIFNVPVIGIEMNLLENKDLEYLKNIVLVNGTPTLTFIENGKEKDVSKRIIGSKSKQKVVERFIEMGLTPVKKTVELDNYVGMNYLVAKQIIENKGLTVEIREIELKDGFNYDEVIFQSTNEDNLFYEGETIILSVSIKK